MARLLLAAVLLTARTHSLVVLPSRAAAGASTQPALRRSGSPRALVGPELADAAGALHHVGSLLAADTAYAAQERMTEEAIKAANGDIGWWGSYIKLVEDGLFSLHDTLTEKGVPFPYGLSILTFVLGVKVVTLPLNYNQLSSAANMKALKPQQDLVKKWYGDNKELLNIETGNLFEKLNVNPLAGCLPSLAQIPVFLGVYYSVTSIAKAKIFDEGFLWIPSLSGPIADRREGISWLTTGWIDGHPKFGWEDTLAYLTIPVILVITQTVSLYLLGTFEALSESDENKTASIAIRFLPFMLGWFAMNAPAGLGLYWVFNNILTTLTTVTVKKLVEKPEIKVEFDLATYGPRRAELAMKADASLPDWVAQKEVDEKGAEGAVVDTEAAEAAEPSAAAAVAAAAEPAEPE